MMHSLISTAHKISKTSNPESITQQSLLTSGLGEDIKLRAYQLDGVEWMVSRYKNNIGCILGDEMGLGKTCQTISYLLHIYGNNLTSLPSLVLAPLSVIQTWRSEISRFAPDLSKLIYIGDKEVREKLRAKYRKNRCTILVTTYELCLKDEQFLRHYSWHTLIVDEAHRLKNNKSLLYQTLQGLDFSMRILLTGTPVQNNLDELYTLLAFVCEDVFTEDLRDQFIAQYTDCEDDSAEITELHSILKPFLLRRVKSDVIKDLPNRTEVVLYHGLSKLQKKYYKAILTKNVEVFAGSGDPTRTRLMNILVQLRKCVNHPYMFDGVEPEPFEIGEHLVEASHKLMIIDKMLPWLHTNGHKVLMFSQMVHMLDILQDYITYRGYNYERLDGSSRSEERFLSVQNFNEEDDVFIFLLSTRAGGQGLNLVSADTVIFVDSDFNPQMDLQAAARAHRIGQTRPVKVIRLIGRDTVEEIIMNRAEAKLQLTNRVIEGGQFSTVEKDALLEESNVKLADMLKFGVDRLLGTEKDDDDLDVDLEAIIGATKDSQWQQKQEDLQAQATLAASQMLDEPLSPDNPTTSTQSLEKDDMYMYEGTDYRQGASTLDRNAFDQLVEDEMKALSNLLEEEKSMRRDRKNAPLLTGLVETHKTRKPLTDEEKLKRRLKREETMKKRAEEERLAKEQRRQSLWKKNNYTSHSAQYHSDSEEEDRSVEEHTRNNTDDSDSSIHYVVGNVCKPQTTNSDTAVIVHCTDDSGYWGYGGVFSALSAISNHPENCYEKAAKMKDLELGDTHIFPLHEDPKQTPKHLVGLMVTQHRDNKNNKLSGIKMNHLTTCLRKLACYAIKHKVSVHLPRIGHATPGFNWYGTERLIKKYLTSRGVTTYIYYYKCNRNTSPKKSPQQSTSKKRTLLTSSSEDEDEPATKRSVTIATTTTGSTPYTLPCFMRGVHVWFCGVAGDKLHTLRRYLVAYDGDVDSEAGQETTHLVVGKDRMNEAEKQKLETALSSNKDLYTVSPQWLYACYRKAKQLPIEKYTIDVNKEKE